MKQFHLSKSRILEGLQCPKRLWLQTHRPALAELNSTTRAIFSIGNRVGEVARGLFPSGVLIEHVDDLEAALVETAETLSRGSNPVFEAAFSHQRVLVRSDILVPGKRGPRLVEVKSSTSVKDYHLQDCAVQDWVMTGAGAKPKTIEVATVNTAFVFAGDGDYNGLFNFEDVTVPVRELASAVPVWVKDFNALLAGPMPDIAVGPQCHSPYECPFHGNCSQGGPEYPVEILPRGGKLIDALLQEGIRDVRDIPTGRLDKELHERVRVATVEGKPYVSVDLAAMLGVLPYPRYYVDFETINPAVPIWADTRPYEQLPFQWSCHVESGDGSIEHHEFLDASGEAPMRRFAESLVATLRASGRIVVYTGFEKTVLTGLAKRFPDLAAAISKVIARLLDLHPALQEYYYHPEMRGSWSLKALLRTVAPELSYANLELVQNGMQAQQAFEELILGEIDDTRSQELSRALLDYCERDTFALYKVAQHFLSTKRGRISLYSP